MQKATDWFWYFLHDQKVPQKVQGNAKLPRALSNRKKDSQTVAWDFVVFLSGLEFPPAHGPPHFPWPARGFPVHLEGTELF